MLLRISNHLLCTLLLVTLLPSGAIGQETGRGFFPPQQAGGGGGPCFAMVQLSLPELNSRLASMGLEGLPQWVSLFGGDGHFQVGHVMIGGFALGGSVERSIVSEGIVRRASVNLSHSGLRLGYVKAVSRMKLTLGGSIGGGHMETRLCRFPQTARSWDDVWTYYESDFSEVVDAGDLDTSAELSGNYFFVEPFFSLRYWVIPLVAVDLGAFYRMGGIGVGKLKMNGESIPEAPKFDFSGMGVRVGIFLGF